MKKKTQTFQSRLKSAFHKADFFGSNITFQEDGNDSFTTNCGALISLLIICLVVMYGQDRLFDVVNYDDSNQVQYTEDNYNINRSDLGFESTKFNFAFSFSTKRNDLAIESLM